MSYLADYELLEWLGSGNHGEWWLARAPERLGIDGDLVAIKALWRDASELDFDRMARELRLLVSISSPHLVSLVEAGESDGRLFYARQHYAGGTLASPGVDRATVLSAVASAARGAQALHDAAVVHRDIKPENVLLNSTSGTDGQPVPAVLSELGLAQLLDPGLTTGIGPVGAIDYVAPEVAVGDKGSPASDVWALGVTLHQALSGHSIYGAEAPDNILDGFRRVTSGRWNLEPSLVDADRQVIEQCLQRDPEARISSAAALADALDQIEDRTGGAPA